MTSGFRRSVGLVVGERNSGKTSVLSGLAAWLVASGACPVVGFVAPSPANPALPDKSQNLVLFPSLERIPWTQWREDPPGYRFDPIGLHRGMDALCVRDPRAVVLIDEWGPLEAGGDGFATGIEGIVKTGFRAALVAVRPTLVEECRSLLGRRGEVSLLELPSSCRRLREFAINVLGDCAPIFPCGRGYRSTASTSGAAGCGSPVASAWADAFGRIHGR